MPDELSDSAFLQEGDALAEQQAAASKARADLQQQEAGQRVLKPSADADGEDALDAHFREISGQPSEEPSPAPKAEAAPAPKPAVVPAEPAPDTSLKGLLSAAKAEPVPDAPKEDGGAGSVAADPYAKHQLPAAASAKSREHFDNLKAEAKNREQAAAQRATAAEQRATQAEARAKELEALASALPPDVEKELKELREHRALFDTQNDPQFQQRFDGRISVNYEGIYRELKNQGLPDSEIQKLRDFPKHDRDAAIDTFVEKLKDSPSARRAIEARILANVAIEGERESELQNMKGKAAEFVKSKAAEPQAAAKHRIDSIVKLVEPQIRELKFLFEAELKSDTPPETRKIIEAHNAFAKELQGNLRNSIASDDPETRASAAISTVLAPYFARENARLLGVVKGLETKLERFTRAAGTSRLAERASPRADAAPHAVDINADSGDAVDAIFKTLNRG